MLAWEIPHCSLFDQIRKMRLKGLMVLSGTDDGREVGMRFRELTLARSRGFDYEASLSKPLAEMPAICVFHSNRVLSLKKLRQTPSLTVELSRGCAAAKPCSANTPSLANARQSRLRSPGIEPGPRAHSVSSLLFPVSRNLGSSNHTDRLRPQNID